MPATPTLEPGFSKADVQGMTFVGSQDPQIPGLQGTHHNTARGTYDLQLF